ncbi:MAG TPA: leucyl aminopeptidase [Longimicrobiales bacterium]|nr:leucyl aminopeptidase [Longimicrobiales bacterium]
MADVTVKVIDAGPGDTRSPLLVVHVLQREEAPAGAFVELDARLGGTLTRARDAGDFRGKLGETLMLYPRAGEIAAERVLVVGAGKPEDYTMESLRKVVGTAVRRAEAMGVSSLAFDPGFDDTSEDMGAENAARAAVEGFALAAWDYRDLKTAAEEDAPRARVTELLLLSGTHPEEVERGVRDGRAFAAGENLARALAVLPGNVATPSVLADRASEMADQVGVACEVFDRDRIEQERMGGLLAVARGSDEEPRFIVLRHAGGKRGDRPIVLVGKGVTFDSGGISIKPAANMEDMKYDMSGAAAVLGAMRAIGELGVEANVVALVPAAENMPSGRALKPGDVLTMRSGKTVEIVNTDAEGRLILADALDYARGLDPVATVDLATLTGAVVIGLGHHAAAVMGNDEELVGELQAAGERSGQRCWPLPLWDEYRKQIESDVADIKNSGGRPAGTITAGSFLAEFAPRTHWAHLDIAGTAYRSEAAASYLRKGATGWPTRLLVEWVRTRARGW